MVRRGVDELHPECKQPVSGMRMQMSALSRWLVQWETASGSGTGQRFSGEPGLSLESLTARGRFDGAAQRIGQPHRQGRLSCPSVKRP